MGLYLPGLVRGANQAIGAYGQGQDRARQQAYLLALQNLRTQKDLADLGETQQRGQFYQALTLRRQHEDADTQAKADYYTTKYHLDPQQPPAVRILQGQQKDRETGAGQTPARVSPQGALSYQGARERRVRQQLLDEARSVLAEAPHAWKLPTLENYLRAKFPAAPDGVRRAAAAQAWTETHRGIGGLLQGGSTVEPPPEIEQNPPPEPADTSGGGVRDISPDEIDQDTLSQDVSAAVQQGHPDETILAQFQGAPQALQDLAREALMRAKGATTAAVG